MAKPQQPELHRSGTTPADPASAKTAVTTSSAPPVKGEGPGPVPEDNRPGHHPAHEQDKPVDKFVARAQAKVRETQTRPIRERAERIQEEIADKQGRASQTSPGRRVPVEAVIPALAFVDAAFKPASDWEEVGASKRAWLAGIALLPGVGAWRYASSLKPRLDAAARARSLTGA